MTKAFITGDVRCRLWAAGVFAAAGLLLAAAWFAPAFRRTGDFVTLALYVGLPGLAAAVAGWLRGPALSLRAANGVQAAWRGAVTGMLGFVIYAPLFALGIKWSEPGWSSLLGLTALTLSVGLLTVGWVIAGVGAVAGWVVWRFGRH